MATGWETFGNVLGGGIDRAGAFEQGRLRTAQTESALGLARQRQLENVSLEAKNRAQEQLRESLAKSGMLPPEQVDLAANVTIGELGSDFNSTMSGLETGQEMGMRRTLADPTADPAVRQLAGQGVQGKVLNPYEVQGNMVNDLRTPDVAPVPTELGEAMIGSDEALTNLRTVQAGDPDYSTVSGSGGATAPGGIGKPPAGYILNPEYDPAAPIGQGNYPYLDARQPVMGARESSFFNRVYGSAVAMERDLSNLMRMPLGTSIGMLGVGPAAQAGTPSTDALAGLLKYQISAPETQAYNAALGGMNRALSFIEGQGLVGSNTIAESYDTLLLRPGESLEMAMYKMAQMKQTVVAGLEPHIANPRVPFEQKDAINKLIDKLNTSIPFEVEDVIALQFGKARSLREASEQRIRREAGGAVPGAAPAPAPAPAAPPAPVAEEVWERGPDGKLRRVQ
jgi:hypothetical protein